jgi:tellurite resistance protein TerC
MQWVALVVLLIVLFVVDLVLVRGRGGAMSARGAAVASVAWFAIALGFGVGLWVAGDPGQAQAYVAGYLVEKSLSLDNVFVFLLVFTAFAVPVPDRHRLLSWGIVGALVLRVVFIVAGAALLEAFSWTSFLFAAFLFVTAWRMFAHRHDHESETALVERVQRLLGRRAAVGAGGAALVAIVFVDLLFAVDSVPAILAITSDPYVVVAANAFALLGLRPLFFLVSDLVDRLYHLKTALAGVLAFVGLKLVLGEVYGKIGPEISLPVIAAILGTGVVASLVRERRLGDTAPQEA